MHADEHLAAVERDAAVHDVAARLGPDLATDLRVVAPRAWRPFFASIAWTMLQADVTYMTPSTTSGVASAPRFISRSYDQARPSRPTLSVLIARERAEALLAVGAAVREPVAGLGVGSDDAFRVQFGGGSDAGVQPPSALRTTRAVVTKGQVKFTIFGGVTRLHLSRNG